MIKTLYSERRLEHMKFLDDLFLTVNKALLDKINSTNPKMLTVIMNDSSGDGLISYSWHDNVKVHNVFIKRDAMQVRFTREDLKCPS